MLELDEGVRSKPYTDTVGKLTIGIGHNLSDNGVSENIITQIYLEDVGNALQIVKSLVPAYETLTDARQAVLIGLAFNLGAKFASFNTFLHYINTSDWDEAAYDLSTTLWYTQVGARGKRYVSMLKTGMWFASN